MRIFKICSLFLLLLSTSLLAQEVKEYNTEKGESLKDVAKKFDLDYKDLMKANPDVSRWPKKNTLIKIPIAAPVLNKEIKSPKDFRPDNKSDLVTVKSIDSLKTHIVQPKETLYSLSKLYDVTMVTIIKENPILSIDGLKIGQELKVPYKQTKIIESSKNHVIKKQETWYGISKLYDVTIENLKVANPEIAVRGLKIGSVLEIPISNNFSVKNQINEKLDKYTHVISQGETLYSVSKFYGIGVTELLAVNDSVIVDSLAIGMLLKLPKKVIETDQESTVKPFYKQTPVFYNYRKNVDSLEIVLDDYKIDKDSLQLLNPSLDSIMSYGGDLLMGFKKTHQLFGDKQWFKDSIITNQPIKAMLMLPFDFKKNDTLTQEQLFSDSKGLPTYVSEFYMGAEIAIDSLKKQGVQLSLEIIDTERSVDSIHKNIDKYKAMEPDVIIGPLYSSNAIYVATQFTGTPVYYPIYSKKQSNFINNNIIKTSSGKSLLEKEMLTYIKENRKGEHLLIVGLKSDRLQKLKNILSKKDSIGEVLVDDVSVISLSNGYIAKDDFIEKIKLDKPNWILIADKNNVLAADVFNNVMNLPEENREITPIRILDFEKSDYINKLSYEKLYKYGYTYATDIVEYEEIENKSFKQTYLRKNYQYPSYYATRGFDVTYDAILRVLKEKNGGKDMLAPTYRSKIAFVYKKDGAPININQAVFVNSIEKTEKEGLKIIRLR